MEVTMSPEQRVKDSADSEEEMFRLLLMLGMSRETIEEAMAFKHEHAGEQERPLSRPRGRSRPQARH
jgi:hypothetical protein